MKKRFVLIGLVLIFILLLVLTFFVGGKKNIISNDPEEIMQNAERDSKAVKDDEKKDFSYINFDQYLEMLAGEEVKIILLARPTCSFSETAVPIIQNIMYENNLEVYYLNTDDFDANILGKFIATDEMWENGFGTPILYLIQNNSIIDVVNGLTDRAHYLQFFKLNGFIS